MSNYNFTLGSIMEFSEEDGTTLPLKVKGKSMHAGYIAIKHIILPISELDNIVTTLKNGVDGNGAYILKDHGYKGGLFSPKSVDLIVGRITDAYKEGREAFYKGRIEDEDMANKIRKKLVSASSIGVNIGQMNCSICGREYGHPDCTHMLGKEYPDEGLHDIAKNYLDEMGGIPKAAVVATGIEALEQSIVLFPAIEGSNIQESMFLSFGEETNQFIDEIESKKQSLLTDETVLDLDYDEILIKMANFIETFNNNLSLNISSEIKMDENTFDFDKLTGELTDLKVDKKLLEASITSLKAEKSNLEAQLSNKDTEIVSLKDTVKAKDEEITTLSEIVTEYTEAEEERLENERKTLVDTLKQMRKDKKLAEKDYSEISMDALKTEFEILSEFKQPPKGSVADDNSPDETKVLEAKEDIREMIFRSRKDQKALKGIVQEKDLKLRVMD